MTSTYEMIKALPGKTYNWTALISGLRQMHGGEFYEEIETLAASKGIRNARECAMRMAVEIVLSRSISSKFIPPSPETLSWGGFLGGEHITVRDSEIEEELTAKIGRLINQLKN